jgi:hypothetical protein
LPELPGLQLLFADITLGDISPVNKPVLLGQFGYCSSLPVLNAARMVGQV